MPYTAPDPAARPDVASPGIDSPPGEVMAAAGRGPVARPERSIWNPASSPATYLLVGINVAVFLWMITHGVDVRSPTPFQLLRYGANDTSLVLNGQWYRLLTATFVHIGLIHLASNMWCLWNLGLLGEPLIGPLGLTAVYMLTGIAGNLLSMAFNIFQREDLIGAGASGAVFGIAGLLIVLLSNRKLPIPWTELKRLRRSVMQFAALNLIIGAASVLFPVVRIDNRAHVGGFLFGLALGAPLVPRMTAGRQGYLARQKTVFAVAALLLALFGYAVANLR